MSQYVDFFIRKDDDFISIGDYSQSTTIYGVFQHLVPYEKIKKITQDMLDKAYSKFEKMIDDYNRAITEQEIILQTVKSFNNSAEEKMDIINDIKGQVEEYEYDKEEAMFGKHFVIFLQQMLYTEEKNPIYCGVEISEPKVEDIVE